MKRSIFHKFLSVLLIAIILCASTSGLCQDAHAAGEALCKHSCQQDGTTYLAPLDGHCPSCPDTGHCGDHCSSTCYCSCHLPVIAGNLELRYTPVITDNLPQQTFTSPKDIFLSLFVPPDNLS